MLEQTRNVKFP